MSQFLVRDSLCRLRSIATSATWLPLETPLLAVVVTRCKEIFIDKSVRSAQRRNVLQLLDHVTWFARGRPYVLVGHSAGGGIGLESAVELQQLGSSDGK